MEINVFVQEGNSKRIQKKWKQFRKLKLQLNKRKKKEVQATTIIFYRRIIQDKNENNDKFNFTRLLFENQVNTRKIRYNKIS